MPLPTMHLWVARKVAERTGFELSGRYLLGSIAPDAVSVKKKKNTMDKQQSHLRSESYKDGWDNALKILKSYKDDPFMRGYALHVMLDHLWLLGPYSRLVKAAGEKYSEDEIKAFYKKDSEYMERWLFRQSDSRSLWTAVLNAPLSGFGDHVSSGEVDMFRKDSYGLLNQSKEVKPAGLFTLSMYRTFMERAADKLSDEIKIV